MKKITTVLAFALGISYASALTCTDLPKNLFRYQETSSVLMAQKFLFEKGFLKAVPNGYFGAGTFGAVKAYQKSLGLEQVGGIGPATRAAIKKESCGTGSSSSTKTATTTSSVAVVPKPVVVQKAPTTPSVTSPSSPVISPTISLLFPNTPQGIRNAKRKADLENILKGLHRYFVDSRGVHPITLIDAPIELCVVPSTITTATTATSSDGSLAVVTPKSPCLDFIDITYLTPSYLGAIPRDPSLATTSVLTGYTITRSQYNDITLSAKNAEDGAIIKVTCNFNGFCKEIKYISTIIYDRPEITTINRNLFLRDATPKTPLIIKGKNFTKKNTIKLFSLYNAKEYDLGEFVSVTGSTATSSSLSIETALFDKLFPCGNNCTQKLPLGDYMLSITNEGGTSNTTRVALRGFTTSAISTQINGPIIPTTKNVRVATLTLSSSIPVTLNSLTLTSTSSSKNLPSKISNFVMKDPSAGLTYSGGSGTFSFGDIKLFENESRVYDIYVDTAEVMNTDAGFITYGGKLLLTDSFTSAQMEVPIKEFSFTISY